MTQYKEKGYFVRNIAVLLVVQSMVRCYGYYANGWRFDSRLADFDFVFFFAFFQAPHRCYLSLIVRR